MSSFFSKTYPVNPAYAMSDLGPSIHDYKIAGAITGRKTTRAPFGHVILHKGPSTMKVKRETEFWVEFWIERVCWDAESKRLAHATNYGTVPDGGENIIKTIIKRTACREKKFMCIGGPFGGQRKSASQIPSGEYVGYNRSSRSRYALTGWPGVNTKVWVHQSFGI